MQSFVQNIWQNHWREKIPQNFIKFYFHDGNDSAKNTVHEDKLLLDKHT